MKKRKNSNEPVDYWDSLADVMVALFLCVLLIMLFFLFYFVQSKNFTNDKNDTQGQETAEYTDPGTEADHSMDEEHKFEDPYPGDSEHDGENNAAGGGGHGGDGEDESHEERNPGIAVPTGDSTDEGEKSAVLVKAVDGETLLPLSREGIEFELYDESSRLMTLNDYYPEREEHKVFQTTKNGQFYLPEKIRKGNYFLRELTEVEGYKMAEDTGFTVDQYYDWDDAYEVIVKLFPLRSLIHVNLVDRDSGDAVTGASFQVVAAENIITLDGSVRYHAGDLVDTIVLDTSGSGESKELYLGKYFLRQEMVPEFYGKTARTCR